MAKKVIYVWTPKAKKLFGEKIEVGQQAQFMGRIITEKNCLESWLKHGYIAEAGRK